MSEFTIEATVRSETGKNANRRLRANGMIPAVVYGHGREAAALAVDPQEIFRVLRSESGHNSIVNLKIGKNTQNALIRDFQLDPVKGHLLHTDFQTISMDQIMSFEVPVATEGTPAGVKIGGILDISLREIELECLPGDVPGHIVINVNNLQIGDTLRVADLELDREKLKILSDPEQIVVHVMPPVVAAAEEAPEEEVIAEPEVIKKGKAEEGEEEQD